MTISNLDWVIIAAFFIVSLAIGLAVSRRAGKSAQEFFLSGRNMPWWLLGVSMVATTFAIDTPNLVTDIVRKNGVSGNWVWWAFLLTGMLTVFVYARLWRRSKVSTDLEFYELRYSGRPAAFLRGFRALYLGFFFNVMIMANVCLAAVKLGGIALGLSPLETLLIASLVTVVYSSLGGLRGVLITDFVQFGLAMAGSVWAAYLIVSKPEIGGLGELLAHPNVSEKLRLLPDFSDSSMALSVFLVPLAVQWWSVWYPGAEPGGGGYVAQRMLSAKNERHAIGATFFFNIAHYALRPWPWIIIALASLVVYPSIGDLGAAFPDVDPSILGDDLAYPAMLAFLPAGVLGLVIASLVAAFMSTISTHLNWGSSYIVNDFYKRFIDPSADEKAQVRVGRLSTALLMVCAGGVALVLDNALQSFNILLSIGAGTGLIFILRWFWWRISAMTEIAGMIVSFLVAVFFEFGYERLGFEPLQGHWQLIASVAVTTVLWLTVTLLTPPTDEETLRRFYREIRPSGPGWSKVQSALAREGVELRVGPASESIPNGLLNFFVGSVSVYAALFGLGYVIYGSEALGVSMLVLGALGILFLLKRIQTKDTEGV
ncbi:sodium:solute symporter family protein [Pelagicoccus sp. SDUM812003]|uniref:sodium:solute symporter family protein n=1 Tax=Pelagicoccus sp. SDUM812003 TaxID=3041267 RepID=UPI00280FF0ED|nr:sodium:solute symporter family protein [Pelagicoccus sp. SDUM812003]MDQ8205216.1 Na+:solute symporter [Pelagicoccus sp. SDUM812003]